MPITPAHILRLFLTTRSCLFPRGVLHVHRSLPLPHLSVVRPIRAILQNAQAAVQHGGDIEEATPLSRSDIVRLHVCRYLALHASPTCIYSHSICTCANFTCMPGLRFPSLYFSRISRIFQDVTVSRPQLQRIIDACEAIGTDSA